MAGMVDGELFKHKLTLPTHGETTIEVVYTNDTSVVETTLDMYEHWHLQDKHKFVGLDLEYTSDWSEVAVFQLCMRKHVLVFQYCRLFFNILFLIRLILNFFYCT